MLTGVIELTEHTVDRKISPGDTINLATLQPLKQYDKKEKISNSQILMDHTVCSSWVHASLIKTGFNTRKTTAKGVRRMKKTLRINGFMPNNAVVIYPDPIQYSGDDDEHEDLNSRCVITETDRKSVIAI